MPPRAVSLLTLVQLLTIWLGVLLTGTLMKLAKTLHPHLVSPTVPIWVQHDGFSLCFLPLLWAVGAVLSKRTLDASPEMRPFVMVIGYVLLGVLIVGLTATALFAFQWAFGYHGPLQGD